MSDKKLGRRIAGSWGRTAKHLKRTANRGTRKRAKLELRRGYENGATAPFFLSFFFVFFLAWGGGF